MPVTVVRIWFAVALYLRVAGHAFAQPSMVPSPRMIVVNRQSMRVWSAGLEHRKPGTPVVVLESGTGSTLEAWQPVFADIAGLAPVVAYDRRGLGQSEFDSVAPTMVHVADTLHDLLHAANIEGPYILAAHSWGVAFVRVFIDRYPSEVAGAAFFDATDFERTPTEEATELPPGAHVLNNAPGLPDGPPGFRAEIEQLLAEGDRNFATLRATKLPPSLPIAIVIGGAARPGLPLAAAVQFATFKRLQIKHQAAWALASPGGLVLMSSSTGHEVMAENPALVLQAIKHVVDTVHRLGVAQ